MKPAVNAAVKAKILSAGDPLSKLLAEKVGRRAELRGLRRGLEQDVFERLAYITPIRVEVTNYARRPVAVFNPGAALEGSNVAIFPRMVFDYYWYVSSVGRIRVGVDDLLSGSIPGTLKADLVIYPSEEWELRGCEDPRVYGADGNYLVLYTGVLPLQNGVLPLQAVARYSEGRVEKLGYLAFEYGGERYVAPWKDSAILSEGGGEALALVRPSVPVPGGFLEAGWFTRFDLAGLTVDPGEAVPLLVAESFEYKVGWSTNALKLSSGEYLVGWHGVGVDNVYRNGLAVVSEEGELLELSEYLLVPRKSLEEFYGDRPGVVFGCGLLRIKEKLVWVGGVSDYAVGVFAVDMDKALEHLKRVAR